MPLEERPMPPTISRRRAETRQRLIDAAHERFAAVGIHDTSVEAICERAGFTRGAFYSNFHSKQELFLALYEQQLALRAARLEEAEHEAIGGIDPADPDRAARIARAIASRFAAGIDEDAAWCPVHLEYRALALRTPDLRAATLATERRFFASIAQLAERLASAFGMRLAIGADAFATAVGALYETLLVRSIMEGEPSSAAAVTDELTEFIAALAAPRPRPIRTLLPPRRGDLPRTPRGAVRPTA